MELIGSAKPYRRAAPRRILAPQGIEVSLPPAVKLGHRRLISVRQLDQSADLAVVRLQHGVMRGNGARQSLDDSGEPVDSFVRSHAPHSIYGAAILSNCSGGTGKAWDSAAAVILSTDSKAKAPSFLGAFFA